MSWQKLLNQNRVERHTTSKQEMGDLRALVARNLHDAALPGLSFDNKLGLSYEAALISAKMVIACSGYRLKAQPGHHKTSFEILPLAMGSSVQPVADFFEHCRRNRNLISYDAAGVVGQTEADDALREALAFEKLVESWITTTHPAFK